MNGQTDTFWANILFWIQLKVFIKNVDKNFLAIFVLINFVFSYPIFFKNWF